MEEEKEITPEEFVQRLNELFQETGYMLTARPEWKPRDDGTWSLVVIQSVQKMENK